MQTFLVWGGRKIPAEGQRAYTKDPILPHITVEFQEHPIYVFIH